MFVMCIYTICIYCIFRGSTVVMVCSTFGEEGKRWYRAIDHLGKEGTKMTC